MNWKFLFINPLQESNKKLISSFKSYLILNMENMKLQANLTFSTLWRCIRPSEPTQKVENASYVLKRKTNKVTQRRVQGMALIGYHSMTHLQRWLLSFLQKNTRMEWKGRPLTLQRALMEPSSGCLVSFSTSS